MVFRSGKESASNVGRQSAEGSEVAPLWLLWGLAATEALAVRLFLSRDKGANMRLCELLLTLCVYHGWRSLSLIAAPPWQTLILGSASSVTRVSLAHPVTRVTPFALAQRHTVDSHPTQAHNRGGGAARKRAGGDAAVT